MIKLSIITTFYNSEKYILKSIESINKQIYNHNKLYVEYLLINDCSTDHSLDLINDYINTHEHNVDFKIFNLEENLGCGGARKYGIEQSSGEYLMFLDSDDYYINKDFISRAIDDITINNADIVEYGVRYHTSKGEIINNKVDQPIILNRIPNIALLCLFKENIIKINVWSKIIRKSLTYRKPYSSLREFEDVDTIPYWVYYASKIVINPSVEINYRNSNNSIISSNMNNTRYLTLKTMLQYFELFKDNKDILLALYDRAMIDLKIILNNKTSDDPLFNEMSLLNTFMLSYIYPNDYQTKTFNLPNIKI